jgi:hypothetical protein
MAKICTAVWVGGAATAGLLAERKPDGDVKTRGHGKRHEDPKIVRE